MVCAFSAGFFLALSLFDLLPEILLLAPVAGTSLGELVFVGFGGFGLLFALSFLFSKLQAEKHSMMKRAFRPRIGLLSTLEFCSHAVLEGLAIGLSFQLQFGLGVVIALAVISHDFCDGISTLALMLNSGNGPKSSIGMLFVDAAAPVLGAALSLVFVFQNFLLVYALTFLLGSFLFIGVGTLLPDAYRMNRPTVTAVFFAVGFVLIFLLTKITG